MITFQSRTPTEYREMLVSIAEAERMLKSFAERLASDPLDGLSKAVQYFKAAAQRTVCKEALFSLDNGNHVGKDNAALAAYFIEKANAALTHAMMTPPHDANVTALLAYQAKCAVQLELYNALRQVEVPK